ncbi:MAG TPA: universal stress protein, partial [Acidimicrobiales bacterium]|nr:universal stress protein [Acidimicrobiales bacterium]
WDGPRKVLVPHDGTSTTAFSASRAVIDLGLETVTTTPVHVLHGETVPKFWDQPVHEYAAWTKEFRARFVDEAIEDGFEVQAGPASPGEQLLDMASHRGFDLIVVVWSQLASGTKADVVFKLLADSPVPILLVPRGQSPSKSVPA